MSLDTADLIVRWTARAFVACYLIRIGLDARGLRDRSSQRVARWIWSLGCIICWTHFAVAFQLAHHGSIREAYQHVLEITARSAGFVTGVGLYVNLGFGILWVADVAFWWRNIGWSERPVPYWAVQVIFAFLIFQATVVFGPSFWTLVAPVTASTLIGLRVGLVTRGQSRLPTKSAP